MNWTDAVKEKRSMFTTAAVRCVQCGIEAWITVELPAGASLQGPILMTCAPCNYAKSPTGGIDRVSKEGGAMTYGDACNTDRSSPWWGVWFRAAPAPPLCAICNCTVIRIGSVLAHAVASTQNPHAPVIEEIEEQT